MMCAWMKLVQLEIKYYWTVLDRDYQYLQINQIQHISNIIEINNLNHVRVQKNIQIRIRRMRDAREGA